VRSLLEGESGARRDIVLLNAGAAIWVAGVAESLEEGIELARRSIDSGAARERLAVLIAASNAGADVGE
jgi:anthranilate phosphoribosyltransferase